MSSEITDAVQVIHILFEGTDLFLRVAGVGIKPLKQLAKLIMGILAREKMEGKTSMKNLLKRGGDMHVFKFPEEQLKKVEPLSAIMGCRRIVLQSMQEKKDMKTHILLAGQDCN